MGRQRRHSRTLHVVNSHPHAGEKDGVTLMGKVIKKSSGDGSFAKGGNTPMFGKGYATKAEPGVSAKSSQGSSSGKFAEGGSGKMFGKGHARQAEAFVSTKTNQ